jgi:hypothetical protein
MSVNPGKKNPEDTWNLLGAFIITPQVEWIRCERDIPGIRVIHGGHFAEC